MDIITQADMLLYRVGYSCNYSRKSETVYVDGQSLRLRIASHDPVYNESGDCYCVGLSDDCIDCDEVIDPDGDIETQLLQAIGRWIVKDTELYNAEVADDLGENADPDEFLSVNDELGRLAGALKDKWGKVTPEYKKLKEILTADLQV